MKDIKEVWNYSIEEIKRGYFEDKDEYTCILCGAVFTKGNIYQENSRLLDAYGAMRDHTASQHGFVADYILGQELGLTGLTEVHRQLLQLMSQGKNDKIISAELGIAASTVRNHRFKLREKEKQAKMFLALMESLEEKTNSSIGRSDSGNIEEVHASATMIDDRYGITDQERDKTIRTYMDENGALKQLPAKEKKKIILLREIMKNFKTDMKYSENEVNKVLKRIYETDYASIRRALIEYGFMERSADCKIYRVKD